MNAIAWVIGSRGLLGSALTRSIKQSGDVALLQADPLPWNDDRALVAAVRAQARELFAVAHARTIGWRIFWAAGAAVTSSPAEVFDAELGQLRLVLDTVRDELAGLDEGSRSAGALFYASSAGGVYAGSVNPPFTEHTVPVPISPYGHFKLSAEAAVDAFSRSSGVPVLSGRIANLYGPGQRLDKMQGLISHIAKAQLSPVPASIYVSLDTIRDYIYIDDCARLICDTVERLASESADRDAADPPLHVVKNLCSGSGVTIATILGYFRTVAKGHPNVMLGSSAAAALQAHDLRVASVMWSDLDRRELTPMPAGIHATLDDLRRSLQLSRLVA